MASEHRQARQKITVKIVRDVIFKGWHFWVLVVFAFFFSQADGVVSNSGLPLWLKQQGYSIEDINNFTTASPAVTIVSSIIWGIIADAYDCKASLIGLTAALNIFACICLAIWDIPVGLKFFAFYLSGTADAIASIIYAWANEICAGNAEERALVIATMNTIGNAFGAWLPLL
jgi:ACS family pantothenate transporter-like MFS transporter